MKIRCNSELDPTQGPAVNGLGLPQVLEVRRLRHRALQLGHVLLHLVLAGVVREILHDERARRPPRRVRGGRARDSLALHLSWKVR